MKICKRNITACILCIILLLGTIAVASASEAAPLHEPAQELGQEISGVAPGDAVHEPGQNEAAEGGHEGSEGGGVGHGAGHGPPFVYWFIWVFLLLTIVALVQYLLDTNEEAQGKAPDTSESKYHSIGFAVVIGIFLVIVVTISLLPSVGGYHESAAVGFTRFLLMIITGFLLMAYGFREHERHKHHAPH